MTEKGEEDQERSSQMPKLTLRHLERLVLGCGEGRAREPPSGKLKARRQPEEFGSPGMG